jgi:hypothetical protein
LVVVVGASKHAVKLVSLPVQQFDEDPDDFYGPMIHGQQAYSVSAGAWVTPIKLDALHKTNRAFLEGLAFPALGADELGYVPEIVEREAPAPVKRKEIKEPAFADEPQVLAPPEPRKRASRAGVLSPSGKPPVIPELRREKQLATLHRLAGEKPGTVEELTDRALAGEFKGYNHRTVRWMVMQMAKHGILREGA